MPSLLISKSMFLRSFNSIIYSCLYRQNIKIKNTIFKSIQQSAIYLSSEESISSYRSHCYLSDKILSKPKNGKLVFKNVDIYGTDFSSNSSNHHSTFIEQNNYTCGDIIIASCKFQDCYCEKYGGAIYIEQDCSTIIHETIFESCYITGQHLVLGAAILVCKKLNGNYNDEQTKELNIQYCCFQNCHNKIENSAVGVSVFAASINITLFFSSTNNCSYIRSGSAQFDMQSDITNSKYVNVTGGKSFYSSSIEYRYATKGFFIFQTILNTSSKYSVAFVQAFTNGISISHCNFVSNILYESFPSNVKIPTAVYIAQSFISINNFYFIRTQFIDDIGKYVNRNGNTATGEMVNCYSDDGNISRYNNTDYITYKNCHFGTVPFTSYIMEHLFLGNCRGNKTADVLVISDTFTASSIFSPSSHFSKSKSFTKSNTFSKSHFFTKSNDFTYSFLFTKSNAFSPSNLFTKSNIFSETNYFSRSNDFTCSLLFTKSKAFSPSNLFTKSNVFSETNYFSRSNDFLSSSLFSNSKSFSYSQLFTKSNIFSKSYIFSKSNDFTGSLLFSNSKSFSYSQLITKSNILSNSYISSKSNDFPLKDVTYSGSHSLVLVTRRSVSFSFSCLSSNTIIYTYLYDIGEYSYIVIQSYSLYFLPYIIKIFSESYVLSYVPFTIHKKGWLTPERLIGIACGSASIFFFILGVIIVAIKKSRKNNSSLSDYISSSDVIVFNKEIENDETKEINYSNSDDSDLNFWL